ncbi:hypothetical protein, partial [Fibrobacter sp. UWCM]|uniref:hypothetical protein n=1 Tax=Fibrobacter sp. UWCM TaxID=1896208 RepID=UPI001C31B8F8
GMDGRKSLLNREGNGKICFLCMNLQKKTCLISGRDEHSQSVEVALIPASAIMWENGKGGALRSDYGVCFSTYGDAGCADYNY